MSRKYVKSPTPKVPDDTLEILISDVFEDDDRMRMLILTQNSLEPWWTCWKDGLQPKQTKTKQTKTKQLAFEFINYIVIKCIFFFKLRFEGWQVVWPKGIRSKMSFRPNASFFFFFFGRKSFGWKSFGRIFRELFSS